MCPAQNSYSISIPNLSFFQKTRIAWQVARSLFFGTVLYFTKVKILHGHGLHVVHNNPGNSVSGAMQRRQERSKEKGSSFDILSR